MSKQGYIGFTNHPDIKDYINQKAKSQGLQHGSQLVKTIVYKHLSKYDKDFINLLESTLCCDGSINREVK